MSLSSHPTHLLDLLSLAHHALLIFKDDRDYGERVLSTKKLCQEAEHFAVGMAAHGIGPGDEVTLLLSQPVHVLSCFWACLMLGASPLIAPVEHDLLSRLMPHLSPQRVIVDQIMEQTSRSLFPPSFEFLNLSGLRASDSFTSWHVPASAHHIALRVASFDAHPVPTIVSLSHHNVLSTLVQHVTATHITSQSILVNWMPLSNFSSLCAGHFAALLQHAGHVLLSSYTFPDDPLLWLHTIHQHRATHAIASRAVTSLIYHHIKPTDLNDLDLSSLVSLWLGPEPLSSRDTYEFCHLLGRAYVKPTIMQTGYGIGQGALCTTISGLDEPLSLLHLDRHALAAGQVHLTGAGSHAVPLLSMGRPVVGCSMRIVNEHGHKLPDMTLGEVVISGPGIPSEHDEKWYHSDTIGFLNQGSLYMLGQHHDRYTCLGYTLYASDLESIVEHHFFSLDGPVAAINYVTHDQVSRLLLLVSCPLQGDALAVECAAIREHLEKVLPQGCADRAHLSILAISSTDYPHMTTHQSWRQAFRHMLAEGQFDLQLARHDIPLPHHQRPEQGAPASTSMVRVQWDAAQMETLRALLDGAGSSLALNLTLDAHGVLLEMTAEDQAVRTQRMQALEPADPIGGSDEVYGDHTVETSLTELNTGAQHITPLDESAPKETLLVFPDPPHSEEPLTRGVSMREIEESEVSEIFQDESFAEEPDLVESLEEDTQQLWLQDRPTPSHEPYQSTYPTQPMVGLSPQAMIPISAVQEPFLMDIVPPEIGWIELVLELPGDLTEARLHHAIQHLGARHEALRVHLLDVEGGLCVQHVQPTLTQPLEFYDLSTLTNAHRHTRTSQILARFRATTHAPRHHRPLVHWLALRGRTQLSLYLLAHHAVLDEQAASQVLGDMERLASGVFDDEAVKPSPPITELVARLEAHHNQLNASEYWTTLFARPYRHISLRDATFPYERRALGMLLERSAWPEEARSCETLLCAALARFIASISPVEGDSLIISVPHDWSEHVEPEPRPVYAMTSPLPVRVTMPGEDEDFGAFVEHVHRRISEAHASALAPEYIARAANISRLVASGTRFAFRWRAHDPSHAHITPHHPALVAYPSPFLNELFLDAVEQPSGDVLLTLHIGEDVQLKHPTMRVLTQLLKPLMTL